MKIKIVSVGRAKEADYKEAQAHYIKMIKRFCAVEMTEVKDEPLANVSGERAECAVKEKESERAFSKAAGFVIACDKGGRQLTSEEFAKLLDTALKQRGEATFLIGGSLGLSSDVLSKCAERVSFSKMTFPHRLFRVILLEQIFRAFKILNREVYHK